MKSVQLSPFNQAKKEFAEAFYFDSSIRDGLKTAIIICLGKLSNELELPKEKRNLFEIDMAIRNISKYVKDIEPLSVIWGQKKPIFLFSLLG